MKSKFEMSMMGELNYFLYLQVKQLKDGIFINQAKYCKDLLTKFEMDQCKAINTHISTSCHLDQDLAGKSIDQTKYKGLIGYLLYITTGRPDIMFFVCMCARFQSAPKESHYNVVKRILKYIQGTKEFCLWYPCNVSLNFVSTSPRSSTQRLTSDIAHRHSVMEGSHVKWAPDTYPGVGQCLRLLP